MALTEELRSWIVPGLAGAVSTVDANARPRIARVWGARPVAGAEAVEFLVQAVASRRFVEGVQEGGRAALNLIEVTSYRSRMFKGPCQVLQEPRAEDFLDESIASLNRAFVAVGMAQHSANRMLAHGGEPRTMVMLRLTVESVFDQSPRPGAGGLL